MRLEGQTGQLTPGCQADLILLDLNTLAFTPLNDLPAPAWSSAKTARRSRLTMVAGKIVVEDGKLLTVDEEAIKEEVRELMVEFQPEMQKTKIAADKLDPITGNVFEMRYTGRGHEPLGFANALGAEMKLPAILPGSHLLSGCPYLTLHRISIIMTFSDGE